MGEARLSECGVRNAECGIRNLSAIRIPNSEFSPSLACLLQSSYSFYGERQAEMLGLIERVLDHAPAESIFVVEADTTFDFNLLRGGVSDSREEESWLVRSYPPAVVGVWRK